jgi:hypothetical protein
MVRVLTALLLPTGWPTQAGNRTVKTSASNTENPLLINMGELARKSKPALAKIVFQGPCCGLNKKQANQFGSSLLLIQTNAKQLRTRNHRQRQTPRHMSAAILPVASFLAL